MRKHTPSIYDVIIVGAGPVGLFLACELRLYDCTVLVLEQAEDPHTPLKRLPFGMRGLNAPTLEALYRRGLLDDLIAAQRARDTTGRLTPPPHWMGQPRRPAGHFAGIQFYHDHIDTTQWPERLPSPADTSMADTSMAVELALLETILAQRAQAMGVEIQRGSSAHAIETTDDAVHIHAGHHTHTARWLVGCDGGRSTIRKAAGFAFVGTEPEFTGYSAEIDLADPQALPPGRHYTATGMYTYAHPGTLAMVDFDGGAFHRSQAITLAHVQAVLRRLSGTDVTLTKLHLASTWTDRASQATHYRKGRVLLAGDAAHIHSPLGGQGLNLGLGDAMNLGWKLAATSHGHAPADLLDSYQQERHPVGAKVLDWSRAQVALMRPTPSTRALAAIIRDLIDTRDGATYFAERVWGVSLRYDLGGQHPLVGRSTPDFEFIDGTKVGPLLRQGKGLLLAFEPSPTLQTLASRWPAQVNYLAGDVKERLGLHALLLRPDGIVAWASNAAIHAAEITAALTQWFGQPQNAPEPASPIAPTH